jgi:beta-lactam-binding protein with PASTA domain
MKVRGCLARLLYVFVLCVVFIASSYFWLGFFIRGKSIPTPNLMGKSIAAARALASDVGLALIVDPTKSRNSPQIAVGNVAWQNRTPGNLIKRGSRLYVGQSLGPLILSVPDLSGQSPRTALLRFSQRNLRLGSVTYFDAAGAGIVAEDPPKGTVVSGQTAVSLLVALPPNPPAFVMPDLIDEAVDLIKPVLETNRLTITNVKYEAYPGIADGIIIRQFPLPGAPVTPRDPITLVVSKEDQSNIVEPAP